MCVHTCNHARVSDRTDSCEVTGRCQSLLCVIATTHHPPPPLRQPALRAGTHSGTAVGHPAEGTTTTRGSNVCCWHTTLLYVRVLFIVSASLSAYHTFSDRSCDFISLEEIYHHQIIISHLWLLAQTTHTQCWPRLLRPEISLCCSALSVFVKQHTHSAVQECLTKASLLLLDGVWYSAGTRSQCSPQQWDKWSRGAAAQAPP